MSRILQTLLAAAFATACLGAQARTLTIGVDLSGSNPLLSHEDFAAQAAQHAARAIHTLKEGDVVRLRSFGARHDASNLPVRSVTISRRHRAPEVARAVAAYLRSLPGQTDRGQPSTNILAFLELGSDFGCEERGSILLITDGLESSSVVSARALLDGKVELPAAESSLRGCALTFYGLGVGRELREAQQLRRAWTKWAQKAGANVTVIAP